MGRILGIDLGMTNSVVGVYEASGVRILGGADRRITPSVVAFKDSDEVIVGEAARNQQEMNPAGTVHSIKRFIGRQFSEVTFERNVVPYEVTDGPDGFAQVCVGGRRYAPQEISAIILRDLKQQAEIELGATVDRAVLAVPAYFNDAQQRATVDAGERAGLTVERIITEPTAAALACGLEPRAERCVVVFDLGGGTFDLSAVRMNAGEFRVQAVHRNAHLGGDDFSRRIIDIVAGHFLRRRCVDVRQDPMILQRLTLAAQQAKVGLSESLDARIEIPFISVGPDGAEHLEYRFTRELFESVCADLLLEIRDACTEFMSGARIAPDTIDDVVMVGGATRMPAIQRIAREVFETDSLIKPNNPDEAVARGAALLGGVLAGEVRNDMLMDVTSAGLSIQTARGECDVLVPGKTPIPTSISRVFSTRRRLQKSLPIKMLEGESVNPGENQMLGKVRVTGIRRAPRGTQRIEVKFDIDAHGMVNVSAMDRDTGLPQQIVVAGAFRRRDEDDKQRLERGEPPQTREPQQKSADAGLRNRAERAHADVSQWLAHNHHLLPPPSIQSLERALDRLRDGIDRRDETAMAGALKKLDELSSIFRRVG